MEPHPRDGFRARALSVLALMACFVTMAPGSAHGMDIDESMPSDMNGNKTTTAIEENGRCRPESVVATATTATWRYPDFDECKLAYCTGTLCGAAPAKWFCQMKGFKKAKAFKKSSEKGGAGKCGVTKSIGTDAICRGGKSCMGFKEIVCQDPVIGCPVEKSTRVPGGISFENPEFDGRKVDFCAGPGEGCGKEAADLFCIYGSYLGALRWVRFDDITVGRDLSCRSTIKLGALAMCIGKCDGFRTIVCESPPQA
ncbi:hypothetical protein BSKO_13692 [Bryopsis sp. KO-2023]|nr:hypothetical protein BSKO_13692 [Bryopsis sp. KO-2023]